MTFQATSHDAERAEHCARWRLLPQWEAVPWFGELIANEFRPPEKLRDLQAAELRAMAAFAARAVPYYEARFRAAGVEPGGIRSADDLPRLPILTKSALIDEVEALHARQLPKGEELTGWCASSGTTGRAARVRQTQRSGMMFAVLKAREARWLRFDPRLVMGEVRLASLLPPHPDGRPRGPSEHIPLPFWRNVGLFFETGPGEMTSSERPVAEIVAWLRERRVAYLMSTPSVLEQLAFFCGDAADLPDLRGFLSISAQLTGAMRARIESCFHVPVQQNYGLNEIGLVASRCPAGRYHVHVEHCLVEIVDQAGQPVPPGVAGRIVVTSLRNFAMPLLRYDTDDLATPAGGPCPCGRTLPGFERVEGRYRRYAFLPEGTRQRVNALSKALTSAPPDLTLALRQYQVHQQSDGGFQLRLQCEGAIPPELEAHVQRAWRETRGDASLGLEIQRVEAVNRSAGGKFLEFTSAFNPPDAEARG